MSTSAPIPEATVSTSSHLQTSGTGGRTPTAFRTWPHGATMVSISPANTPSCLRLCRPPEARQTCFLSWACRLPSAVPLRLTKTSPKPLMLFCSPGASFRGASPETHPFSASRSASIPMPIPSSVCCPIGSPILINTLSWVPYAQTFTLQEYGLHDHHQSYVIARLKPDVSAASATTEVSALQSQLHLANASKPVSEDAVFRPMIDDLVQDVKTPLIVLLCAVGCMLLIACLNVSNLLVARSATRRKEVAVRLALGGSRLTLVREQMIESF